MGVSSLDQSGDNFSKMCVFEIGAPVGFWCIPLIRFPRALLEAAGLPAHPSYMFVPMPGWAYLALCVGYGFGLVAALEATALRRRSGWTS
jgi:hypothetical protein